MQNATGSILHTTEKKENALELLKALPGLDFSKRAKIPPKMRKLKGVKA